LAEILQFHSIIFFLVLLKWTLGRVRSKLNFEKLRSGTVFRIPVTETHVIEQ